MQASKYKHIITDTLREQSQSLWTKNGSVMVYLVVVLLIFGVLGVTMVSLFTTATSSSATPNDARRAFYLAESADRYAVSELRKHNFDGITIEALNSGTYTLNPGGSFRINAFSPWFKSRSDSTDNNLEVYVPVGSIPAGFSVNANDEIVNFTLINFDFVSLPLPATGAAAITGVTAASTSMDLNLNGNFIANKNETVCLAVHPSESQTLNDAGESLSVSDAALNYFPARNGAVYIIAAQDNKHGDYFYEERIHDSVNNKVIFTNLSRHAYSSDFPLVLAPTDYVILSPRNYMIITTGTSGDVTYSGDMDHALNIYDASPLGSLSRNPDIDFNEEANLSNVLNQKETNTAFIKTSSLNKTITVGGGSAISEAAFGSVWFNADKAIGGRQGFCTAGACEFGLGIRVFFTLDYTGTADGLTFALINSEHNNNSSAGGDLNMGELLGYAGDSRKVSLAKDATAVSTNFLDGKGDGLKPPKMALEFDTFTNNGTREYCGTYDSQLNNNRNDPFSGNQDAVQYIFWGFTSLAMPCRDYKLSGITVDDHGSYDDNRHDSGELDQPWTPYATAGAVRSTPTVAPDGTIYVGSDDGRLYAINPDGTRKWRSVTYSSPIRSSPAIGDNGVVYVGTGNGWVLGFAKNATDPDSHNALYTYPAGPAFQSSPVIDADGNVYLGTESGLFYGFTPSLSLLWQLDLGAALSFGRPAIGPDGTIYVTTRSTTDANVYALNPTQRELDSSGLYFPGENEWEFSLGTSSDGSQYMPGVDSTTGTIYADNANGKLIAITPDGAEDWEFNLGSDFDSTPVVGPDGTVYFGADDRKLYAINPADRKADLTENTLNSTREWAFSTGDFSTGGEIDTTPAIAPDGTIVVLANNSKLYAVNGAGTLKWTFSIPVVSGSLVSSPTVGDEGTVYVGSADNKLYAINNFALPRNLKDNVLTAVDDGTDIRVAGEIVTVDSLADWLNGHNSDPKAPWAVRMEVMRSLSPNANSMYEYTLHTWIRQCASAACENIFGTFYENTRIEYAATPDLEQTIELDPTQHSEFNRFIFGFTGAKGTGQSQSAVIGNFKLSFIRANDPVAQ